AGLFGRVEGRRTDGEAKVVTFVSDPAGRSFLHCSPPEDNIPVPILDPAHEGVVRLGVRLSHRPVIAEETLLAGDPDDAVALIIHRANADARNAQRRRRLVDEPATAAFPEHL